MVPSMRIIRQMADGLANLVTGLGTRADARSGRFYAPTYIGREQIEAAFNTSPMLRKCVVIPATDRIRAWRDWQAEADQIEALEAEERRLQLLAKVRQAEILRGLGGGALILVTAGDPAMPLNQRALGKGGLVAVNVVSRWHLTGSDWIDDLASPDYGTPSYFEISGGGNATRIHPSRVVCFRGDPLPSITTPSLEEQFWGRGCAASLIDPAMNLDEALSSFGALIKDARNIDIGVPKLLEMVATAEGESTLMRRLALLAQGSSIINANVYDNGDGEGKGGEKIERHQVTWTGIPEVVRVYAEALSAASDIPVTRLWGVSPRGMNATGEHDEQNWRKMIEAGQELELRPCMEQIDAALIPSALGSAPEDIWWKFSPLHVPSEKEETDRFKVWVDAAEKVQATGAIPDRAYAKAYQNGLVENGWMAGLEGALAEVPESERYGLEIKPGDDDPRVPSESIAARGITNDYNPSQPRDPAGLPTGGQWSGGGRMAYNSNAAAEAMAKIIDEGEFDIYGLRVVHSGDEVEVGEELPNSFRWEEGERTNEELDGVSTIGIGSSEQIDHAVKIVKRGGYEPVGEQVVLVGGESAGWGEDPGERVIRNARVLAVFGVPGLR